MKLPHLLNIRVYYEDTDAGGVVYHARYLAFAERARAELLRDNGVPHEDLVRDEGLIFLVRRVEMDYLRPARLDEVVTVATVPTALTFVTARLRQDFSVGDRPIARLAVELACVRGTDGRPSRIPARWARGLRGGDEWIKRLTRQNLAAGAAPPGADLSILTLFLQADIVVKLVMIVLLLASVWVWAIVFEKIASLRRANRQADAFEDRFWSGGSLDELYDAEGAKPTHPVAAVFGAAMGEWRRSARVAGADMARGGVRERVDRAMAVTVGREMERMERWMIFLASVGSTAPFIGLFGTVWGIMHSFAGIAASKNTSLAVVAPGIAEALFATAIGLVAAIPAVLAYNKISTDLARFAGRLESFGTEFGAILSRQSEERA